MDSATISELVPAKKVVLKENNAGGFSSSITQSEVPGAMVMELGDGTFKVKTRCVS